MEFHNDLIMFFEALISTLIFKRGECSCNKMGLCNNLKQFTTSSGLSSLGKITLPKYFSTSFRVYTTPKLVQVKSPIIAKLQFSLHILIWLSFLASISFDFCRLFKSPIPMKSAVLTEVEGVTSTEHLLDEDINMENPFLYKKIWDSADLVYFGEGGEGGTGSFSIVTNMVIVANQSLGTCPSQPASDYSNSTAFLFCEGNWDCEGKIWRPESRGIFTGNCVNSTKCEDRKWEGEKWKECVNISTCEIKGWCPPEPPSNIYPMYGSKPILEEVFNFTFFLKTSVDFPGYGETVLTNVANETNDYLGTCSYNYETDPLCPRFKIGEVILGSKADEDVVDVLVIGAVYRIRIGWRCEFDFWKKYSRDNCDIQYSFRRVDDKDMVVKRGWNFRSTTYSGDKRTLTRNYGLKFLVEFEGHARKFDVFLFITMIGSTIGYFSLTALVCDHLVDLFNWLVTLRQWRNNFHEYCHRVDEPEPERRRESFRKSGKKSVSILGEDLPRSEIL